MNLYINTNYDYSSNKTSFCGKGGNSGVWNKFKQRIIDTLSDKVFGDNVEKWDKFNNFMAKPAENRAIMGGVALVTQPAIDYYNHRVDEETREVSRNRTIAKILAGTTVGICVRELCYRLVNSSTKPDKLTKFSQKLLPKKYVKDLLDNPTHLKNYRNALSTIVALCVMTFTNFLLDAPLTVYMTNKFNEYNKIHPKEIDSEKQEDTEVRDE